MAAPASSAAPVAPRVDAMNGMGGSAIGADLVLAALPMALSVVLEWAGAWPGSNLGRALTGLPVGAAVGALLVQTLTRESARHAQPTGACR